MPKVELHSKADCVWCDRVREHLNAHNIPFTEIKHDDRDERHAFYDSLGLEGAKRTLPQVFLLEDDDERLRIGGYQEMVTSGIESLFRS